MEEIREHHHDHHDSSSGWTTLLIALVVLLVLGFLLWNFLPIREERNTLDVNTTTPTPVGETQ